MMGAYKINVKEIGLSAGLKQWYKMLKQRTSLEFEALPDTDTSVRVSIRINVRLNLSMCFQDSRVCGINNHWLNVHVFCATIQLHVQSGNFSRVYPSFWYLQAF